MKMIKNNRGWIEIVEAVVAILLVAGVLLILANKGYIGKTDISEQVYTAQLSMLREIETNDAMRAEILAASLPSFVPTDIQTLINTRAPNYLTCQGQVCDVIDCPTGWNKCTDINNNKYCYSGTCPTQKIDTLSSTCTPPTATQCSDVSGDKYCYGTSTCLPSSNININPTSSKCDYLGTLPSKDVYAQDIIVTSTLTKLDYRKLKLFCWAK